MNGPTEIAQFIEENMSVVDEDRGPVVGASLHHYGVQEAEVYSMTAAKSGDAWGHAVKMADMIDRQAVRHAAGVIGGGAQQFALILFRSPAGTTSGEARKASHTLPFVRYQRPTTISGGQAMIGPGHASLASEPPTPWGAQMQGQRLLEQLVQGGFAMIPVLFNQQGQLLERVLKRLETTETDARETFMALVGLVMKQIEAAHAQRLELLKFQRTTLLQNDFMRLLPAVVNSIAGRDVFPTSAQDESLIRTMHRSFDPTQIRTLCEEVAHKNPVAGAALVDRFAALDREAQEDAAEMQKLVREAKAGNPEADAAGDVVPKAPQPEPAELSATVEPKDDAMSLAEITIRRDHTMPVADARKAVEGLVEGLAEQFHAQWRWEGNRLALTCPEGVAKGTTGTIEVGPTAVTVRLGSFPMVVRMMKGQIEKSIVEKLNGLLR